jgi:hypothetical protein
MNIPFYQFEVALGVQSAVASQHFWPKSFSTTFRLPACLVALLGVAVNVHPPATVVVSKVKSYCAAPVCGYTVDP